jgi:hypothetical protein
MMRWEGCGLEQMRLRDGMTSRGADRSLRWVYAQCILGSTTRRLPAQDALDLLSNRELPLVGRWALVPVGKGNRSQPELMMRDKRPPFRPCLGPWILAARRLYAVSEPGAASAISTRAVQSFAFCVARGRWTRGYRRPFGGIISLIRLIIDTTRSQTGP